MYIIITGKKLPDYYILYYFTGQLNQLQALKLFLSHNKFH